MKRGLLVSAAVLGTILTAGLSRADTGKISRVQSGWIVDVMPASILSNFKVNDFDVSGPEGREEMSLVSAMPTVGAGYLVNFADGYADIKGGTGLLLNTRVRSYLLSGAVEGMFEVKRSVMVGPHLGVAYFLQPEWWGDAEVQMDNAAGVFGGVSIIMGDRISYILSVDYLSLSFDTTGFAPGWSTEDSQDKIDMSGVAVQFGLRLQF